MIILLGTKLRAGLAEQLGDRPFPRRRLMLLSEGIQRACA
jgi:hypothetical protein